MSQGFGCLFGADVQIGKEKNPESQKKNQTLFPKGSGFTSEAVESAELWRRAKRGTPHPSMHPIAAPSACKCDDVVLSVFYC